MGSDCGFWDAWLAKPAKERERGRKALAGRSRHTSAAGKNIVEVRCRGVRRARMPNNARCSKDVKQSRSARAAHASKSLTRPRAAKTARNTRTTQDISIIQIPIRYVLETSCQGDVTVGRSEEVQTSAVSSAIVQSIMQPASERRLADRRFLMTSPCASFKTTTDASISVPTGFTNHTTPEPPLFFSHIKNLRV